MAVSLRLAPRYPEATIAGQTERVRAVHRSCLTREPVRGEETGRRLWQRKGWTTPAHCKIRKWLGPRSTAVEEEAAAVAAWGDTGLAAPRRLRVK